MTAPAEGAHLFQNSDFKYRLPILAFVDFALVSDPDKPLPRPMARSLPPMFSSKSFTVSGLTFEPSIDFELLFVYDVREGPTFVLLHVSVQNQTTEEILHSHVCGNVIHKNQHMETT